MDYRIVAIHASLIAAAAIYGWFLEQVHEYYAPRYIWVTVVGGDILIGLAFAGVCALDILPWLAFHIYATLHIAAGAPIIVWQLDQNRRRDQQLGKGK